MNIKIVSTIRRKKIAEYCDLAYGAGLYTTWGCNRDWYRGLKSNISCFVLALDGSQPVGSCLYLEREPWDVSTYVLPAYRRKGIGKKMLRRITRRRVKPSMPDWGATPNFYESVL